jgi:suppressor of fused
MDVVEVLDGALGRLGSSEVMHAIDPGRIVGFADGGPPVWSVGVVEVEAETPFSLFVTYGLSHVLSPEAGREGIGYELSLAVPARCPTQPWAVALLRHLSRYVLSSGNELMAGDVMPCHAPLTYLPFPPAHHASMPATELDSLVIALDPQLGQLETAHGPLDVRRIVGITSDELHRLGPLPANLRAAARAEVDPALLTDLG